MTSADTLEVGNSALGAIDQARIIAERVASVYADEVDRDSRFPCEALEALRQARLLGAVAPRELGGLGCSVSDLGQIASELARGCAATAMIWAMHQSQLACLVRHGGGGPLSRLVTRICVDQLLLASATSEIGVGGDTRRSLAAIDLSTGYFEKAAPTISYGSESDAILVTLRRSPEAATNDQVLVLMFRNEIELTRLTEWDAMGMRGTCSSAYKLAGEVRADHIFTEPFDRIAALTMVPFAHILWSMCWVGIAEVALEKARRFLRVSLRQAPGTGKHTNSGARLAVASSDLRLVRSAISEAARALDDDITGEVYDRWSAVLALNEVKLATSRVTVNVVQEALAICGMAGYLESGEYSVSRCLRDICSAPLMISNERLLATNAQILISHKEKADPWLAGSRGAP